MTEQTSPSGDHNPHPALRMSPEGPLVERISSLVEQTRSAAAATVNSALTLMNWHIGRLIDMDVLREGRAGYDREIVATLSPQLATRYGRGFDKSSLHRMIKLSQVFPDVEVVAALSRQLGWSHLKELLPVSTAEARQFYIDQAIAARLSVRGLRELIGRQGFERNEIADAQTQGSSAIPADSFRDPYLLDFLGLRGAYGEQDLEAAIAHDLEAFLLEVGNGWAFVARQKRMARRGRARRA